ncbi:hypothetical protein E3N88_00238 [Mikania micrantha]|uniref:Uncharacterized protein n=1 Tax=Mikania micrantha TaxID=192012 RepID=A0A5N6PXX1_9ASTR|nr:hypothetical protein E3N88_00238 [Mikania micrantha]
MKNSLQLRVDESDEQLHDDRRKSTGDSYRRLQQLALFRYRMYGSFLCKNLFLSCERKFYCGLWFWRKFGKV